MQVPRETQTPPESPANPSPSSQQLPLPSSEPGPGGGTDPWRGLRGGVGVAGSLWGGSPRALLQDVLEGAGGSSGGRGGGPGRAVRLSLGLNVGHISPVREMIQVKNDPSPGVHRQKHAEDSNYVHHESCFHLRKSRVSISTHWVGRVVRTTATGHWEPEPLEEGVLSWGRAPRSPHPQTEPGGAAGAAQSLQEIGGTGGSSCPGEHWETAPGRWPKAPSRSSTVTNPPLPASPSYHSHSQSVGGSSSVCNRPQDQDGTCSQAVVSASPSLLLHLTHAPPDECRAFLLVCKALPGPVGQPPLPLPRAR